MLVVAFLAQLPWGEPLFASSVKFESVALAARRYYAFWNTGDPRYAQAALASDFIDRNLPPGRPQGPEGPQFASKFFRAAVPDLRTEVQEMLLVGDRVVGRLHFTGHFTGTWGSGSNAKLGASESDNEVLTRPLTASL